MAGKEGRQHWRPSVRCGRPSSLGERGLANRNQQVIADFSGEHVIYFLKADKLGFQVAYSLLQAAHR